MPHHIPQRKNGLLRATETPEDISHQYISSYFIGPQAENLSYFEQNIHTILDELRKARTNYFQEDGVGVPFFPFSPLSLPHTIIRVRCCDGPS